MFSGRATKMPVPFPPVSKDEGLRDIEHIRSIGNLILGVNAVAVSYLICYDRLLQDATSNLLQNATEVYYKIASGFLLQNGTILLQNATYITNCDSADFIKKRNPTIKAELHLKYKNHRNLISTLLKSSTQNYYKKYFESAIQKIIWKGIKSIITMKNVISMVKIQSLTYVKLLTSLPTILPQLLILQCKTLIILINAFLNT